MSGPCTNCTDLTLGRQQHALFQTITFYYPLRHVSVKGESGSVVHSLSPGWTPLWPDPALSLLGGCVHHPLRHLSSFSDSFVLDRVAAVVVASSPLIASLQLIMQMREGKNVKGKAFWGTLSPHWFLTRGMSKEQNRGTEVLPALPPTPSKG